jgi:flagellar motor switch protein FliM
VTETHEPLGLDGRTYIDAHDRDDAPARPRDHQWYQSSGRPRELAWLAEGFATSLSAAAGGLLRADLSARLAALSEMSRRQFAQAVEEPTCAFHLVPTGTDEPDPAAITCIEFSPAIALTLVERLMGGPFPVMPQAQRPLTPAERRVLMHLANLVAVSLSATRPGGTPGSLRADSRPAVGGSLEDPVIVATFELSLAGLVGTMRLCACGQLGGDAGAGPGPKEPRRIRTAPLKVTAAIDGLELDSAELADLDIGDVLATDVPADGEITIRIGGIPKYAGRLRIDDGRKIVTIIRRLDGRKSE